MPRRTIFSAAERISLLALPHSQDELIRHYTLSESDLSIIRLRRGSANRIGFAIQLCYLRYPGVILGPAQTPKPQVLKLVSQQLKIRGDHWHRYGAREQTRRAHLVELQTLFGFTAFTLSSFRNGVQYLTEPALGFGFFYEQTTHIPPKTSSLDSLFPSTL
jgi:TnpA family transposase